MFKTYHDVVNHLNQEMPDKVEVAVEVVVEYGKPAKEGIFIKYPSTTWLLKV